MYGKIHQSLYTGSLLGSGPDVFAVWGWVIAHVVDGVVEINPTLLAMVIGKITADEVCEVLKFLGRPDKNSRTQAEDGRRLIPIPDGPHEVEIVTGRAIAYRVVNHALYRDFKTPVERRDYMRDYMRRKRKKEDSVNSVNSVNSLAVNVRQAEAEAEAEAEARKRNSPPADPLEPFEAGPDVLVIGSDPATAKLKADALAGFSAWSMAAVGKTIEAANNGDYPIRMMVDQMTPADRARVLEVIHFCHSQAKPFKKINYAVNTVKGILESGEDLKPKHGARIQFDPPRRKKVTRATFDHPEPGDNGR